MRADFAAEVDRGLNRGKVDVGRVDPRLDGADKFTRQTGIARRIPRFDQRLPLPVMGPVGVIVESAAQGHGGFALMSLGAQTKVNAKNRAFRSGTGKYVRDQL